MYTECRTRYPHMDGAILVAAVADYKPKYRAQEKIKRSSQTLPLSWTNRDIAAALGSMKKESVPGRIALKPNMPLKMPGKR